MSKKILIVDDSRLSRMIIKALISDKRPDWEIKDVANAEEALKLVAQESFDGVTLDVNMPGKDGLTLGKELREILPNAALIIITANIQDSVRDTAHEYGLNFVTKPLNEEKFQPIFGMIEKN